jgi:hypothetical protein
VCEPSIEPVLGEPLPDPYVHREGDEWHLFGTGEYFFHGKTLSPAAMKREELELDFGSARRPAGIWSFMPYRDAAGAYHAYCTLHYGNFRTVVAHLVPQRGEAWTEGCAVRKWRLDQVLVGSLARNRTTYYDARLFADDDGEEWLVYSGSERRHGDVHILAQRMLDPGRIDRDVPPRPILSPQGYRSEDRNPGYLQLVEGANIFKVQGKYVLLYSVGDFGANNYKLGAAFSDSLIPAPGTRYKKVLVPDVRSLWGNTDRLDEVCYLLQSEIPGWPNYCGGVVSGPGLGNIIRIGGEHHLVFHAYRPGDGKRHPSGRRVWMLPLNIDVSDHRPMWEWIRAALPCPAPKRETEAALSLS